MQPAALPAPDNPETWDDLKQPNTPHYPRLPFPAARSSGSRPATSRTPPRRPWRPGSARVLDLPGRSPQTWQLSGNRRRQSRMPSRAAQPAKPQLAPPLTRPRSFRDEYLKYLGVTWSRHSHTAHGEESDATGVGGQAIEANARGRAAP